MRKVLAASIALSMAALPPITASWAEEPGQPNQLDRNADEAAKAAREALDKLMRLLNSAIGNIPQYQAPEVLPNGDIIIRRIPNKPVPKSPAPKKDDSEHT